MKRRADRDRKIPAMRSIVFAEGENHEGGAVHTKPAAASTSGVPEKSQTFWGGVTVSRNAVIVKVGHMLL